MTLRLSTSFVRCSASALLAALLVGCGGGGSTSVPTGPQVTSITADRVSYGQLSRFTLQGQGLDNTGVKVSAARCTGLTLAAGGIDAQKTVTCTVAATGAGAVVLEARDAAGALLRSAAFDVPEPQVTMTTGLGTVVVELNPTTAPVTVNNFLQYVQAGFYDDTVFHRVIAGFVAQGGWLTPAPAEKAGRRDPIVLESNKGLSNLRGSIAMARTTDPNSATSQFYFNLVDNPGLNYASDAQPGYAVFGRVVSGQAVVDAIGAVATGTRYGLPDFPLTDVVVQTARQTR